MILEIKAQAKANNDKPAYLHGLKPGSLRRVQFYIKQLRSEGMKEDGIKSRLAETSFSDVEILQPAATTLQSEPATALPAVQEEHHNAPALFMVVNDLEKRIDAKIAALERSREPSFTVGIGIGFIAALLFVLVIVGIAVLYGGFR